MICNGHAKAHLCIGCPCCLVLSAARVCRRGLRSNSEREQGEECSWGSPARTARVLGPASCWGGMILSFRSSSHCCCIGFAIGRIRSQSCCEFWCGVGSASRVLLPPPRCRSQAICRPSAVFRSVGADRQREWRDRGETGSTVKAVVASRPQDGLSVCGGAQRVSLYKGSL